MLDGTNFVDKEFNMGIWSIAYNGLYKIKDFNENWKISRAASAVRKIEDIEVGFICGSILNPKDCFEFDGTTLTLNNNILSHGHTDEAAMIDTQYGLLLLGGGENPFYLNNKGDKNPENTTRHGIAEISEDGQTWFQSCAVFPYPIVETTLVELKSRVWLFGGYFGEPKDWVYTLDIKVSWFNICDMFVTV